MKIKNLIAIALLMVALLPSCNKKDDFNYPAGTVGNSRITYFPILSLIGDDYIAIPVGGTYTEAGVDAKEGGAATTYTTDGSVDTNTPGVYTLTYTAVNKDGFTASVSRYVAIYSTDASATANDFSGTYVRSSNGVSNTWTKLAPGVYKVLNPGGAAGAVLTAIIFNPTGNTIDIPEQVTNDGATTSSTDEVYNVGPPASYSMKIVNPGYGPALRTFVKQ